MDVAPARRRPEWAAGSLLARLSQASRNDLLSLGATRRIASGRRLFQEGDRGSHVELLRRGFVKITSLADGRETLLSIRAPGNVLGELGAVSGEPRNATVTACGV